MLATFFKTADPKNKFPKSPFDDNTFIFNTIEVPNHKEFIRLLADNCCLNVPLGVPSSVRCSRKLSELKKLYKNNFTYIMLDVECNYKENLLAFLKYIKKYRATVFESRSYDGVSNFNVKCIIDIESCSFKELKVIHSQIASDLISVVNISPDTILKTFFTSALLKNKIVAEFDGLPFQKVQKSSIDFLIKAEFDGSLESKNTVDLCLEVFNRLGFEIQETKTDQIVFIKGPELYTWYKDNPYVLHHRNILKSISVYDIVSKYESLEVNYKELLEKKSKETIINIDEPTIKVTDEISDTIEKFLFNKNSLLSIKSPMATGKSKVIEAVISESVERGFTVLVITPRISIAEDFIKKYEYNFKLYAENTWDVGDNLVVQYDSLWKYNINNFDVVIMDEFISLMIHSRNNLTNNPMCFIKFNESLSKRLVISDAFLTGYENQFFNKQKQFKINNNYREDVNLVRIDNKNTFFKCIIETAKRAKSVNKKIVVSNTSSLALGSLQMALEDQGLKVAALTAETPQALRNMIYDTFDELDHNEWDVLLYSPVLTVGVSIKCDVITHFHFDSAKSADVISSLQMLRRSRNTRTIIYYMSNNTIKKCIKESVLRDSVIRNLKPEDSHLVQLNNYGELVLTNAGSLAIKIDVFTNILALNQLKVFEYFLEYQFKTKPRIVEVKTNLGLDHYITNFKQQRKVTFDKIAEQYLNNFGIENIDTDIKIIDICETIRKKTYLDLTNNKHKKLFKELLNLYYEDHYIINKIRYYKILKMNLDIQQFLSESINNNNKPDINFFNAVLKFNFKLGENYKPTKESKFILSQIGYEYVDNKFVSKYNMERYTEYVKI